MNGTAERVFEIPWRVKDALLATALAFGATIVIIVAVSILVDDASIDRGSWVATAAFATLSAVLVALALWVTVVRYGAHPRRLGLVRARGRWSIALPWVALVGSLTFSLIYVNVVTAAGAEFLRPEPVPSEPLGEGAMRWANFFIIGLVGPFAEEIFFRGFLLASLVNAVGQLRGALLGSVIFALAHGDIRIMVPVFTSGMLLSWLYLKTRSLGPPITAHAAQNLLALSVAA